MEDHLDRLNHLRTCIDLRFDLEAMLFTRNSAGIIRVLKTAFDLGRSHPASVDFPLIKSSPCLLKIVRLGSNCAERDKDRASYEANEAARLAKLPSAPDLMLALLTHQRSAVPPGAYTIHNYRIRSNNDGSWDVGDNYFQTRLASLRDLGDFERFLSTIRAGRRIGSLPMNAECLTDATLDEDFRNAIYVVADDVLASSPSWLARMAVQQSDGHDFGDCLIHGTEMKKWPKAA